MAPPRLRSPSGHEIEVLPESVYQLLHRIDTKIDVNKADTDLKIAGLASKVEGVTATWKDKAVTQLGVLGLAVITIIGGVVGGQKLTEAPAVNAPAPRTLADTLADECRPMAVGSQERFECFDRVRAGQTYGRR